MLIAAANKPYDRFTEATLDFGDAPIGTEVIRTIEVFNQAQVHVLHKNLIHKGTRDILY